MAEERRPNSRLGVCLIPGLDIAVCLVALRACSLGPGPMLEATGRALESAPELSCSFHAAFFSIQHSLGGC